MFYNNPQNQNQQNRYYQLNPGNQVGGDGMGQGQGSGQYPPQFPSPQDLTPLQQYQQQVLQSAQAGKSQRAEMVSSMIKRIFLIITLSVILLLIFSIVLGIFSMIGVQIDGIIRHWDRLITGFHRRPGSRYWWASVTQLAIFFLVVWGACRIYNKSKGGRR